MNYDYELNVPVDRDGKEISIRIKEIPYSVYKAAKPHFKDNAEKAIMIILNDVTIPEDKEKLKVFNGDNLVALLAVENLLSELIVPIGGAIKKNSKSTK